MACNLTLGTLWKCIAASFRGTSLMINFLQLGPYSRPMPRVLRWFLGGRRGRFLKIRYPCRELTLPVFEIAPLQG